MFFEIVDVNGRLIARVVISMSDPGDKSTEWLVTASEEPESGDVTWQGDEEHVVSVDSVQPRIMQVNMQQVSK